MHFKISVTIYILAIHHSRSNLQFPVDCRFVYGHQDGKYKKKQEERGKQLEEETEGFAYKTEAESSESEAETMMTNMFQLGEARPPKRYQKIKHEPKLDSGDEERTRKKKLMDEVMMNIVCDDIAMHTIAMVLRGEEPPPGPVMELPYMGSRAMLWIKQIWITSKYKAEVYSTEDRADEDLLQREVCLNR